MEPGSISMVFKLSSKSSAKDSVIRLNVPMINGLWCEERYSLEKTDLSVRQPARVNPTYPGATLLEQRHTRVFATSEVF
jgi:hypothetical protein